MITENNDLLLKIGFSVQMKEMKWNKNENNKWNEMKWMVIKQFHYDNYLCIWGTIFPYFFSPKVRGAYYTQEFYNLLFFWPHAKPYLGWDD